MHVKMTSQYKKKTMVKNILEAPNSYQWRALIIKRKSTILILKSSLALTTIKDISHLSNLSPKSNSFNQEETMSINHKRISMHQFHTKTQYSTRVFSITWNLLLKEILWWQEIRQIHSKAVSQRVLVKLVSKVSAKLIKQGIRKVMDILWMIKVPLQITSLKWLSLLLIVMILMSLVATCLKEIFHLILEADAICHRLLQVQ